MFRSEKRHEIDVKMISISYGNTHSENYDPVYGKGSK